jgi:hypothetical protein
MSWPCRKSASRRRWLTSSIASTAPDTPRWPIRMVAASGWASSPACSQQHGAGRRLPGQAGCRPGRR